MKILIVTDTWNSINGVVTTYKSILKEIENDNEVHVISPYSSGFKYVSLPKYEEIKIVYNPFLLFKLIEQIKPTAIHIATEGPLGIIAKIYCTLHKEISHTTSYHTRFPEYLKIYYGISERLSYWYLRLFHKSSYKVLVTNNSMKQMLESKGFKNLVVWSRGVDRGVFDPYMRIETNRDKPVLLCVSRASYEKNIDDFCKIQMNAIKVFIGDGPYLNELKQKYSDVYFLGYKTGAELAWWYANSDVFVFPSKSDTYGIVMLEAMSAGTPVAAYPVVGPIDIVEEGVNGYLTSDLNEAIMNCLKLNRAVVADSSEKHSWKKCAEIFLQNLVKIN